MQNSSAHKTVRYKRAFAIGVSLNIAFVIIEVVYGIVAGSLALIADAGHNLSDVVSLLLAWGASFLATKDETDKRTYGFRKATILASLTSAVLLLTALGGIAWEAIRRFQHPAPIEGTTVIVVAGIGVVINAITALLFVGGKERDLNIRAVYLHMVADAGVSLGVVVAGIVIVTVGWPWVDPLVSLIIVAVVFIVTWGLLRDSVNYSMDAVPNTIDLPVLKEFLINQEHVVGIHDLHVWPLSTTEIALTVHLVVEHDVLDNHFLRRVQDELQSRFGIEHATIQVENARGKNICLLYSREYTRETPAQEKNS